jgi:hypothetical protein
MLMMSGEAERGPVKPHRLPGMSKVTSGELGGCMIR